MAIKLIACIDKNGGIGKDNKLLTHLPKDLKHFKETTKGHIVVFGRKTWEYLPKKPLKNRINVVLTSDDEYVTHSNHDIKDGIVWVANSIEDIEFLDKFGQDVYICGGEAVYKQFVDIADEIILSYMYQDEFYADSFFPIISSKTWCLVEESKPIKDKCEFKILKYKKRKY